MNYNVDQLWEQALIRPQQVLKLLPVSPNPIWHLLKLFSCRVLLSQQKRQEYLDDWHQLEGTTLVTAYRLEYFANYHDQERKLFEREVDLVSAIKCWKKESNGVKEGTLVDLVVHLKDTKLLAIKSSQLWHLFFLDFIVPDLLPLTSELQTLPLHQISTDNLEQKTIQFNKIDPAHLLTFLSVTLPLILHSVTLQPNQLPFSLRNKKMQLLYIDRPLQWVLKKAKKLAFFNRSAILALVNQEKLNFQQQSVLMQAVFRYFYIYHQHRQMKAVQILFEAYNKLEQPARFALSASFALFLQRAKKLGKLKMVQAMASKSKWIEELQAKTSAEQTGSQTYPESDEFYGEAFILKPGEEQRRYFEIVQQYTIGYVCLNTHDSDIEVQIRRVCGFEGKTVGDVLMPLQKTKSFRKRIVFRNAGLYLVEISNASSWVSSKKIAYRTTLLSPLQLKPQVLQNWKQLYLPLNSYAGLSCSEVTFFKDQPLAAVVVISKAEHFHYELKPTGNSAELRQSYETDSQLRFLQRLQLLFSAKKPYSFVFKDQSTERELLSYEELVEALRCREGKKKEKSVVIEIAIKKA